MNEVNEDEESVDDEVSNLEGDKQRKYDKVLAEIQTTHLPILESLLQKYDADGITGLHVARLRDLHNMFAKPKRRLTYPVVLQCLGVLRSLTSKKNKKSNQTTEGGVDNITMDKKEGTRKPYDTCASSSHYTQLNSCETETGRDDHRHSSDEKYFSKRNTSPNFKYNPQLPYYANRVDTSSKDKIPRVPDTGYFDYPLQNKGYMYDRTQGDVPRRPHTGGGLRLSKPHSPRPYRAELTYHNSKPRFTPYPASSTNFKEQSHTYRPRSPTNMRSQLPNSESHSYENVEEVRIVKYTGSPLRDGIEEPVKKDKSTKQKSKKKSPNKYSYFTKHRASHSEGGRDKLKIKKYKKIMEERKLKSASSHTIEIGTPMVSDSDEERESLKPNTKIITATDTKGLIPDMKLLPIEECITTDINLDGFENSDKKQLEKDASDLENSTRRLEALMKNRLNRLSLEKKMVKMDISPIDSEHNDKNSLTTSLDEIMANLVVKNKLNRRQNLDNVKKPEVDIPTKPIIDCAFDIEDDDIHYRVRKFLKESKLATTSSKDKLANAKPSIMDPKCDKVLLFNAYDNPLFDNHFDEQDSTLKDNIDKHLPTVSSQSKENNSNDSTTFGNCLLNTVGRDYTQYISPPEFVLKEKTQEYKSNSVCCIASKSTDTIKSKNLKMYEGLPKHKKIIAEVHENLSEHENPMKEEKTRSMSNKLPNLSVESDYNYSNLPFLSNELESKDCTRHLQDKIFTNVLETSCGSVEKVPFTDNNSCKSQDDNVKHLLNDFTNRQEKYSEEQPKSIPTTSPVPKTSIEYDSNSKSSQSLRSKLSAEIGTLHKVGAFNGGALKGLINRDKMMPPGRIASLKPGTLIDLIQEDKPQRPTKKKKSLAHQLSRVESGTISHLVDNKTNNNLNQPEPTLKNETNEILSKLSQNDLEKLINENIGNLPEPPKISFINDVIKPLNINNSEGNQSITNSSNSSWSSCSNSFQQNQSNNASIKNLNFSQVEYYNRLNSLDHTQTPLLNSWPQNNEIWRNTSNSSGININQHDQSYNSSLNTNHFKSNGGENSSLNYNPPVLQTDPMRSPCYDGTTNPDPYRPDPYTLNLQRGNYHNSFTNQPSQRPGLLGSIPTNLQLRNHVFNGAPLHEMRRHSLGMHPTPLKGTPNNAQHDLDSSRVYSSGHINTRCYYDSPKGTWMSGDNMPGSSNPSQQCEGNYYDRSQNERRNYSRYKWTRQVRAYDQHNRDPRKHDDIPIPAKAIQLSSRDPRRKNKEEDVDKNEGLCNASINNRTDKTRLNQHDPRLRDKKLPPGREKEISNSRRRSPNRGLSGKSCDKSPYRKSQDKGFSSKNDRHSKDQYKYPLDHLYSDNTTSQTKLGYGLQNFKIPKINRRQNDTDGHKNSKNNNMKSKQCEAGSSKISQPGKSTKYSKVKNDFTQENNALDESDGKTDSDKQSVASHNTILKTKESQNDPEKEKDSSESKTLSYSVKKNDANKSVGLSATKIDSEILSSNLSNEFSKDNNVIQEKLDKLPKKNTQNKTKAKLKVNKSSANNSTKPKTIVDSSDTDEEENIPLVKLFGINNLKYLTFGSANDHLPSDTVKVTDLESTDNAASNNSSKSERLNANDMFSQTTNLNYMSSGKTMEDIQTEIKNSELVPNIPNDSDVSNKEQTNFKPCCLGNENAIGPNDTKEQLKSLQVHVLDEKTKEINNSVVDNENIEIGHIENFRNSLMEIIYPDNTFDIQTLLNNNYQNMNLEKTPWKHTEVGRANVDFIAEILNCILRASISPNKRDVVTSFILKEKMENHDSDKVEEFTKSLCNTQNTTNKNDLSNTGVANDTTKPPVKKIKKYKKKRKNNPKIFEPKQDPGPKMDSKKPKRRYKNELDRLQDDISGYYDSEAIETASGMRMCRLKKEKGQGFTSSLPQTFQKNKKKDDKQTSMDRKEAPNSSDSDSNYFQDLALITKRIQMTYGASAKEEELRRKKLKEDNERKILGLSNKTSNKLHHSLHNTEKENDVTSILPPKCEFELGNLSESKKIKCNKCTKNQSVELIKSDLVNHDTSSESDTSNNHISHSILHKYGIKKPKKKCLWKDGIIKKKTKPKKPVGSVEINRQQDYRHEHEQETGKKKLEEDIIEQVDKMYYQEGPSLKTTHCKLCSYNGKTLVSHYAITHPKDEVMIARMSPEVAAEAVKESKLFFNLSETDKRKGILSKCRICFQKFPKLNMFFEHMALHTGEFRHECCKCGYRTSTRSGILKHWYVAHDGKNIKPNCRTLYNEPSDIIFFSGYMCLLCNFFQISHSNVKRHVENFHDEQNYNNVVKIHLSKLSFNDNYYKIFDKANNLKIVETQCSTACNNYTTEVLEQKSCNERQNELSDIGAVKNISSNMLGVIPTEDSDSKAYSNNIYSISLNSSKELLEDGNPKEPDPDNDSQKMIINDGANNSFVIGEECLNQNSRTGEKQEISVNENLNIIKGCFVMSSEVENSTKRNSEELIKRYEQQCAETLPTIARKIKRIHNSAPFIEELESKIKIEETIEITDVNAVITVDTVIVNKSLETKKEMETLAPVLDNALDGYSSLAANEGLLGRRQLPERTCKAAVKLKLNENDSDNYYHEHNDGSVCDEDVLDLFKCLDDTEINGIDDSMPFEEICLQVNHNARNNTILFDNLFKRCENSLRRPTVNEPNIVEYMSALSSKSNLSEFTYIMNQINKFILKPPDSNILVGGFKVVHCEDGFYFCCSIKIFKKDCGFFTKCIETLGKHVCMSHQSSFWDGTCASCFTLFLEPKNSTDNGTIFTQSRAFCHLVKDHLVFMKKPQLRAIQPTNTGQDPPRPLLRVRRLSGDKLSTHRLVPEDNSNAPILPESVPEVTETSDMCLRVEEYTDVAPTKPKIDDEHLGFSYMSMVPVETAQYLNYSARLASLKTPSCYETMCQQHKLRDFYKCMADSCSFTTMNSKMFSSHIDKHRALSFITDDCWWRLCAYCLNSFKSGREIYIHMRKEHGECLLQCGYCFYRAKCIINLEVHHNEEHKDKELCILQCEQKEANLPPYLEKPFTDFITPLRCTIANCSLFTYMLDKFFKHLRQCHLGALMCHLCAIQFKADTKGLLQHYKESHDIGLYQCLYCLFGASTEHDIRLHLCYKHPNLVPKGVQRMDSGVTAQGAHNRESLRRIVFERNDHNLGKKVIPLPPPDKDDANSESSNAMESEASTIAETHKRRLSSDSQGQESPTKKLRIADVAVDSQDNGRDSMKDGELCGADSSATEQAQVSKATIQPSPQDNKNTFDENYYGCGNEGCTFKTNTETALKSHMVICDCARTSLRICCPTCKRKFKQAASLIRHQRIHGPPRLTCSLCGFKDSVITKLKNHMKTSHQVNNIRFIPVDSLRTDVDRDDFTIQPKEKLARGAHKTALKNQIQNNKYGLNDILNIPKSAVFYNNVGCAVCDYVTKVRSNLVRHLMNHAKGDTTLRDEVNAVPVKAERMFDKMMNLANSCHKKRLQNDCDEVDPTAEAECMFKYVSDKVRYMCHVPGCNYRTVSDTMLKNHITIIHSHEQYYLCPHCPTGTDPVVMDQIGLHLKLHDSPLFKCSYCTHYSHVRRSIERHLTLAHSKKPVSMLTVRTIKPNEDKTVRPQALEPSSPATPGEEWFVCNICSHKTKKKKFIISHALTEHRDSKLFKCISCNYESNSDALFKTHVKTYHSDDKSCEVVCIYSKVVEKKEPVLLPMPPIWKRNQKRLKHIRGIRLDEKGDAPPPVATCVDRDVNDLDILELKFGAFGRPAPGQVFVCPRCPTFQVKNRQEMREHLIKDLQYKPYTCKICNLVSIQRVRITKHLSKAHKVNSDTLAAFIEVNHNEDMEAWVEKVITTQQGLFKEVDTTHNLIVNRKHLSSCDNSPEETMECAGPEPSPSKIPRLSLSPVLSVENESHSEMAPTLSSLKGNPTIEYVDGKKSETNPEETSQNSCSENNTSSQLEDCAEGLPNPSVLKPSQTVTGILCSKCPCVAIKYEDFKTHYTSIHKTNKNLTFRTISIRNDEMYGCYACGTFGDVQSLEKHYISNHHDLPFLLMSVHFTKYKCSECNLEFTSVELLKMHFSIDHTNKEFNYIIVRTLKNAPSSATFSTTIIRPINAKLVKRKVKKSFKCCNCPFSSENILSAIKHVKKHYVTYACRECDNLFPTAFKIHSHIFLDHPGSDIKPLELKGSDKDIENAIRNIIVTIDGVKRKITREEIEKADYKISKNSRFEDKSLCAESSDSKTPLKGTARKSTGSPKKLYVDQRQSYSMPLSNDVSPKNLLPHSDLSDVFVNVSSKNKLIKLPGEHFQTLFDTNAAPLLNYWQHDSST